MVTAGRVVTADDSTAPTVDGYKNVVVKAANGRPVTVRVRQQPDALAHASFPDELDHQHVFSATNPMATKTFSMPTDSASPGATAFKDQDAFVTKPYSFNANAPSAPNLNQKASVSTSTAFDHGASDFDKSFAASKGDSAQNRTALLASSTATEQGRTATLETSDAFSTHASSMNGKTFQGSEADAFHRSLSRNKDGQIVVSDLPDRPLTIDEVRELLNHGFKPDTSAPPPEPSKPLNDPNYVPEPLRDNPQPENPHPDAPPRALPVDTADDDKDDAVPPPGTMAAPPPENTQPLPQP